MASTTYGCDDFQSICAGAAILASGGGGSFQNALSILKQLAQSWSGTITVQDYDGATAACVVAMMGSPDAGDALTLADIQNSTRNTLQVLQQGTGYPAGCVIPVEIGAINSLVPLIAAAASGGKLWVVDGDGAGRAVPQLPQTTFAGAPSLPVGPCALATSDSDPALVESALLNAPGAEKMEHLAAGVVGGFGGFSGIALWPSDRDNNFGLKNHYIPGTLSQLQGLGRYLRAGSPRSTTDVAQAIQGATRRATSVVVRNFYITGVRQATSAASLDTGMIQLDNNPDPAKSTDTRIIYNMNENLLMYNASLSVPDVVAPDSICYYSEWSGRGFSNADNDLAQFFDAATGTSTGKPVSILKIATDPMLYATPGVKASFAQLLRSIGYAGALPPAAAHTAP